MLAKLRAAYALPHLLAAIMRMGIPGHDRAFRGEEHDNSECSWDRNSSRRRCRGSCFLYEAEL